MNSNHSITTTPLSTLDLIDDCNDPATDNHIKHQLRTTESKDCVPTEGRFPNTVRWKTKVSHPIQWTEQLVRDITVIDQVSRSTKGKYLVRFKSLWAKNHLNFPATGAALASKMRRVKVQSNSRTQDLGPITRQRVMGREGQKDLYCLQDTIDRMIVRAHLTKVNLGKVPI